MAIFSGISRFFSNYECESLTFSKSLILFADSIILSLLPPPFIDFRSGVAGCFLLVFIIVSSVSIIITTINNNIYNYRYKYKKKLKLLNQISKWKKKKKANHSRPNTSIDLLRDILPFTRMDCLLLLLLLPVRYLMQ